MKNEYDDKLNEIKANLDKAKNQRIKAEAKLEALTTKAGNNN